ncbi:3-phosphoshikimate 1-carboxyvinyltransferase, partial [Chloroflexota bacterium]
NALLDLGVDVTALGGLPPVVVRGGYFKGGTARITGDVSSQYISALLLAAPLAEKGVRIKLTTPLESVPYVRMTAACMRHFGVMVIEEDGGYQVQRRDYRPAEYRVEGDWSSASYLLALGALSDGVTVNNLQAASLQSDRALLDVLAQLGADITYGDGSVTVSRGRLRAFKVDLADAIDLLPTVAVLAAFAEGKSELTGIRRARLKESDRVAAVVEGLKRLGIAVTSGEDYLSVTGGEPGPAVIESHGDHRIAMAFSLPGVVYGGVTINGAECVGKTFPQYWGILENIGGKVAGHDEQPG